MTVLTSVSRLIIYPSTFIFIQYCHNRIIRVPHWYKNLLIQFLSISLYDWLNKDQILTSVLKSITYYYSVNHKGIFFHSNGNIHCSLVLLVFSKLVVRLLCRQQCLRSPQLVNLSNSYVSYKTYLHATVSSPGTLPHIFLLCPHYTLIPVHLLSLFTTYYVLTLDTHLTHSIVIVYANILSFLQKERLKCVFLSLASLLSCVLGQVIHFPVCCSLISSVEIVTPFLPISPFFFLEREK